MRAHAIVCMLALLLGCPREQDAPPGNDTEPSETEGASESGTGDGCLGAEGCYACEPIESEQLLDYCTDANCEPFADTPERLSLLLPDGSRPPTP